MEFNHLVTKNNFSEEIERRSKRVISFTTHPDFICDSIVPLFPKRVSRKVSEELKLIIINEFYPTVF